VCFALIVAFVYAVERVCWTQAIQMTNAIQEQERMLSRMSKRKEC